MIVFNDVVSVAISGANCWQEQSVWMLVSINECVGCWREPLGLLLSLWPFSVCSSVVLVSLVSSVILRTSNVLHLSESRLLIDFLFIIMFCFTRSMMMSAKASLVILEAVVLVMKSRVYVWAFVANTFQMINSLQYLWFEMGYINIGIYI